MLAEQKHLSSFTSVQRKKNLFEKWQPMFFEISRKLSRQFIQAFPMRKCVCVFANCIYIVVMIHVSFLSPFIIANCPIGTLPSHVHLRNYVRGSSLVSGLPSTSVANVRKLGQNASLTEKIFYIIPKLKLHSRHSFVTFKPGRRLLRDEQAEVNR